jgi:simple sugar transport system ATP-binding protein
MSAQEAGRAAIAARRPDGAPVLEVEGLSKSYGVIHALRDVSFSLRAGEVVGLLGDNGAGKSTLVGCLSGTRQADVGVIRVDGAVAAVDSPEDARALGIETVFQDLAVIDTMDVPTNLFLNREKVSRSPLGRWVGWLDRPRMEEEARQILDTLDIRIRSFRAPVGSLSGGQRQAIAVGRAVAWGRHIVLLDEPTAALGVEESAHVLELIERLVEQGIAVILISHNMQHVQEVCTRVVVLRHGSKVADQPIDGLTGQDLVGLITGGTTGLKGV